METEDDPVEEAKTVALQREAPKMQVLTLTRSVK